MRNVTVAATQMGCDWHVQDNINQAEQLVRAAHAKGAQIILLQELFERCYFCQKQRYDYLTFATPLEDNPAVKHFQALAAELKVVLPVSFYERHNNAFYNSIAIIDADGRNLGLYRKSHIPDGPGYSEKFYFTPGDTGFKVWKTAYATIGVGICWDQWYPECARAMALMGAELLLYPTAIGSEPQDSGLDSRDHWQRVQCGHAGANLTPLIASNRVGRETEGDSAITFYGSSFIADETGAKVAELDRTETGIITHTFDLDAIAHKRHSWGIFRDRRIDLFSPILTKDGVTR
ncbi:N-carbamoylputrescine amidase [Nitrincola nitratireducens]|uniref:N-carbamoyl-D-amino acid hydrolase n=1 Tax=Nitrincola nitratireducens TaxID=1229521 RepID=W9VEX9_9GAMM|nr:N-carbamoylputrescine amidase [Nitrincola nitratireducens]EXJ09240.1 N-carbamoyl-D-amino acid hydrolase [Nitrincola nitratireducens]